MPLHELCQQLLVLAAGLTAAPEISKCPQLEILEPSSLRMAACGDPGCGATAYFDRERRTIILSSELDFDFAYARSVLLHELVHYLQDRNGRWDAGCSAGLARELEAFKAQEAYLLKQGYRVPVSRNLMFYSCAGEADTG